MIREEAENAGHTALRHSLGGIRFYSDELIDVRGAEGDLRCIVPATEAISRVYAEIPLGDRASFWRPSAGYELRLPPDWKGSADLSSILRSPFGVLHDDDGQTSVGIGVRPAESAVSLRYGVSEESAAFVIEFTLEPSDADRELIFDGRGGELFDTVARVREATRTTGAHAVSLLAAEPVYSTWYSFHAAIDAPSLLAEARIARQLGFGSLFLDYGWQNLGDSRYFDGCGDWVPDLLKFPDLRGTVDELHAIGLGVVLWVAPLLLGARSAVNASLAEGATVYDPNLRAHVLDPRLPAVREHVVSTCLRLVEDFGVDGLKIDFIDAASAYAQAGDVIAHSAIASALVDTLGEVRTALDEAGHRGLLIEYREPYTGVALAGSGDVIRAEDCPGDFIANRRSTLDLRVLGTGQLVHSDMMMWDPALPGPIVSALLSNATFSVPQLSMRLGSMSMAQREEISAWIKSWRETSHLSLHGNLVDLRPHLHYPGATAVLDDEALAVIWSADTVFTVPPGVRKAVLVNGTRLTTLSLRLPATAALRVVDHRGSLFSNTSAWAGRTDIDVPVGGRAYLELSSYEG